MKSMLNTRLAARPMLKTAAFLSALALSLILSFALPTRAEEPLSGEVLVILASEASGAIDPSLAQIPALNKPPFNAFRSMKVLTRTTVSLTVGKPVDVGLPNNRRLNLTLQARRPDGRSRVQVSINRPNEKDYLPLLEVIASPGEPFFVAGQKYQNGTLVIGVRMGTRPNPAR
jgi:hypothetical protein